MGPLNLDRLPLGVRRALPFGAALVLGMLAWQMPVLAERGGGESDEIAAAPFGVPTTTTVPASGPDTADDAGSTIEGVTTSPPTTRFIPPFAPTRPSASPTTTRPTAPPTTSPAPSPPTTAARITGPLRITKSTWGSNTLQSGTPAEEAPEGVLPVELASYIESKKSYIEVRGTAPTITLQLSEHESPPDASPPIVVACEIATRFWDDKTPGASFEDSPAYDAESCVDGTVNEDGAWTFDLSGFGDLHDHPGFALAPVTDGTLGTYSVWYDDPRRP